jgi:hypothetical protein
MSDIELVIKIPESRYRLLQTQARTNLGKEKLDEFSEAVLNGTPLPKGHGRLGDLDALEKEIVNGIKAGNYEEGYETFAHINDMDDCVDCVRYADTIIEADKAKVRNRNERYL